MRTPLGWNTATAMSQPPTENSEPIGGHQEPYNVQFWSLGNEFGYGHMEGDNTPAGYCQIALENGKKMLEASPGLSLCSSGPYPNKEWAEFSAKPLAGISQMISQHYYGYDPHYTDLSTVEEEYNRCMASVSRMRELIHQSRQWLEPSIRFPWTSGMCGMPGTVLPVLPTVFMRRWFCTC